MIDRRHFIRTGGLGLAGLGFLQALQAAAPNAKIRVGARHFGDNLKAAREAGMDGAELGVGGPADQLKVAGAAWRQKIKDQSRQTGLPVCSLSMDLLNGNPVATEARAVAWLAQTIEATGDLGAAGILVPFFGNGNLLQGRELKRAAMDSVVARVKEVAPQAQKAKVCLGLENTCSAAQNLQILDRIASEAVACYYDIGNSTGNGYDVPAEIRQLKGRIGLVHFKDGSGYLGEGKINMKAVAEALAEIRYEGWIILETSCPSKDTAADCRRNADFIRRLLGTA